MKTPARRFANCQWKIKRANTHIAEVDAIIDGFHKPDSYTVREDRDPHTGQKIVEYGFAKNIPREDLALAMGDAAHNLKCTLDYAWIHCMRKLAPAVLRRKRPFAKFPMYPSLLELENTLRGHGIEAASSDFYNLIVSDVQPYDGADNLLWSLHKTDNWDKHNLLIPVLDIAQVAVTLEDDEGNIEAGYFVFTRGGRYSFPLKENQKLKDKGNVHLDVVIQEGLPSQGLDISTTLRKFSGAVLGVVETLEAFLETA